MRRGRAGWAATCAHLAARSRAVSFPAVPPARSDKRSSDLVEELALALAGLEVLVALDRISEVKGLVDADLEVA